MSTAEEAIMQITEAHLSEAREMGRSTPKLRGDHFALVNGCRPTLYA